ncbi:MAG: hypothetical protein JWM41_387 [Gemmatimonadetes bacterium]|nr:hypothetical protein [Gemmatimonadota bacterium]
MHSRTRIAAAARIVVATVAAVATLLIVEACGGDQPTTASVPPAVPPATPPAAPSIVVANVAAGGIAASSLPQLLTVSGSGFSPAVVVSLTAPSGAASAVDPGAISNVTATSFDATVVLREAGSWSVKVASADGVRTASAPFTVRASPSKPVIASISPAALSATLDRTTFTVAGYGVKAGAAVRVTSPAGELFSTTPTLSAFGDSVETVVSLAPTLTGVWSFAVQNPDGARSDAVAVTVRAPTDAPTITDVHAAVRQSNGDRSFAVTGSGFLPGISITLTSPAGVVTPTIALTLASAKSLVFFANIPDVAGLWTLRAKNVDGSTTNSFAVHAPTTVAPTVTGVALTSPRAGDSTTITLTGTDFLSDTRFTFVPPSPGVFGPTSAPKTVSSTLARGTGVFSTAGTWGIRAETAEGVISDAFSFVVSDGSPAIRSVTPARLISSAAPQTVVVAGDFFRSGLLLDFTSPSGAVTTMTAAQLTGLNGAARQAQIALTTAGDWAVRATNTDGLSSAPFVFTVTPQNAPLPVITRATLVTNAVARVIQTDTLIGTGFQPGLTVGVTRADGTKGTSVVGRVTATTAEFSTDFYATATAQVVNPDGGASAAFRIPVDFAPPVIGQVVALARADTLQSLRIVGRQFQSGASVVLRAPDGSTSTVQSTPSSLVDAALSAQVKVAISGSWTVTVVNPDGKRSGDSTLRVAEYPAMTLSAVNPSSPAASLDAQALTFSGSLLRPELVLSLSHRMSTGAVVTYSFSGAQLLALTAGSVTINAILAEKGAWTATYFSLNSLSTGTFEFTVR